MRPVFAGQRRTHGAAAPLHTPAALGLEQYFFLIIHAAKRRRQRGWKEADRAARMEGRRKVETQLGLKSKGLLSLGQQILELVIQTTAGGLWKLTRKPTIWGGYNLREYNLVDYNLGGYTLGGNILGGYNLGAYNLGGYKTSLH